MAKRQIDDRHLRPGTKVPSNRNFAETYKCQPFHGGRGLQHIVAPVIENDGNFLISVAARQRWR
jgi:DNA-binding transcriptional regulator YhcF (GntR family)